MFSEPAANLIRVHMNREPIDLVQLVRYYNIAWADFTYGNFLSNFE